jgi:hypothetical protein
MATAYFLSSKQGQSWSLSLGKSLMPPSNSWHTVPLLGYPHTTFAGRWSLSSLNSNHLWEAIRHEARPISGPTAGSGQSSSLNTR